MRQSNLLVTIPQQASAAARHTLHVGLTSLNPELQSHERVAGGAQQQPMRRKSWTRKPMYWNIMRKGIMVNPWSTM